MTRVVIIGGGFAGLYAARRFSRGAVEVTLVDRQNYHLFQPLLYQVATAGLSPGDIATPIRSLVAAAVERERAPGRGGGRRPRRQTRAAHRRRARLRLRSSSRPASATRTSVTTSGSASRRASRRSTTRSRCAAACSPPSKRPRRKTTRERRATLLTFVVVGGGPTGRRARRRDRRARPLHRGARLPPLRSEEVAGAPPRGGPAHAHRVRREAVGEGRWRRCASWASRCGSTPGSPTSTRAAWCSTASASTPRTVLWGAGVQASPLSKSLGCGARSLGPGEGERRSHRSPGSPTAYVVGDLARVTQADGIDGAWARARRDSGR